MEVTSCSQIYRTQLIVEYDEGLQRTPELERRQQSCVACRFLHEVHYDTMSSITAVAATEEEQVSPHHRTCVYHRTAVQQSAAEKPIHLQPTNPPCVYNNSTAVQQKKKAKRRDGDSTDALSRIDRSTVETTANVVIACRLLEGNFENSPLAEFGCDDRSFAGAREGCCVGGTWRGRGVSGDRVAPRSSRC